MPNPNMIRYLSLEAGRALLPSPVGLSRRKPPFSILSLSLILSSCVNSTPILKAVTAGR